ncbi:MAG: nuclear transport factor 2 family protein [Chitinophagaceae bacterium]
MPANDRKIDFQVIEDNLNKAYESNDVNAISRLLSDDWTNLESSTGLTHKTQFLNAISGGTLVHTIMKKAVLQIRLYNDFAIMNTKGKTEGRYNGHVFNAQQWTTNIYRKINDQWLCVMTQETPVSC